MAATLAHMSQRGWMALHHGGRELTAVRRYRLLDPTSGWTEEAYVVPEYADSPMPSSKRRPVRVGDMLSHPAVHRPLSDADVEALRGVTAPLVDHVDDKQAPVPVASTDSTTSDAVLAELAAIRVAVERLVAIAERMPVGQLRLVGGGR
jgi:hypothetical protein